VSPPQAACSTTASSRTIKSPDRRMRLPAPTSTCGSAGAAITDIKVYRCLGRSGYQSWRPAVEREGATFDTCDIVSGPACAKSGRRQPPHRQRMQRRLGAPPRRSPCGLHCRVDINHAWMSQWGPGLSERTGPTRPCRPGCRGRPSGADLGSLGVAPGRPGRVATAPHARRGRYQGVQREPVA
jgi:hypothetical protein